MKIQSRPKEVERQGYASPSDIQEMFEKAINIKFRTLDHGAAHCAMEGAATVLLNLKLIEDYILIPKRGERTVAMYFKYFNDGLAYNIRVKY